jgi:hypothetical protein
VIEILYLKALAAEAAQRARTWLLWKLLPADVTSVQLYRMGPKVAVEHPHDFRVSLTPETHYRPGSLA